MRSSRSMLWLALAAVAVVLAPMAVSPYFLMKAYCFMLFACAFNLLFGVAGLLSFGHAAYFGMAAYVTAHALKVWSVPPEVGVLIGTACALVMGAAFGWIAIRRLGIYFSMITLALSQLVYFVCLQAPFTHGEEGLQNVPRGKAFGLLDLQDTTMLYAFIVIVVAAALGLVWRIVHSPFGQVLKAIRENETRAVSLGYPTARYKLLAYVLSATLAGIAGSLKVLIFQLATLTDVHWHASGEVVLMALLGGIGTVFGPAAGALVLVGVQTYFAQLGAWVTIIQGLVFVVCVLMFRRGIVGEALALLARRTRRP
jgi:branched-chain amino acid transport system permease protein